MSDTAKVIDDALAPPESPLMKPDWWRRRYTFTGAAIGLVFLWLSMTPSLLPRGPLSQGLVSGAAGAVGYAVGVLAVWVYRYMCSMDASPRASPTTWVVLVAIGEDRTPVPIRESSPD